MQSIYNRYHCCTPDKHEELGLDKVSALISQTLTKAKDDGHDYNHVAYEIISMITCYVGGMHLKHGHQIRMGKIDG